MERFSFKADKNSRGKLNGLIIGYLQFSQVKNEKTNEIVDSTMDAACAAIKNKFADPSAISEDTIVRASRNLYSNISLDPTKNRPSGEALIRRIVKGKGIYRISAVVDINNIISLLSGFPCGVYDIEKIAGNEITVLVGAPGLTYPGIGGREVGGENRILTSDSVSVFGGPTADSQRTSITTNSKEILMIIYCPPGIEPAMLKATMEKASLLIQKATGGKEVYRGMYFVKEEKE